MPKENIMSEYAVTILKLETLLEHLRVSAGVGEGKYITMVEEIIRFLEEMRITLCETCTDDICSYCLYNL